MKERKNSTIILFIILIILIVAFGALIMFTKNKEESKVISKVTNEGLNKVTSNKLATLVEIGDFVDYDAGIWSKAEITSLGDFYEEEPEEQGKFGGFKEGDSRNISITPYDVYKNIYNGWRVLKIADENQVKTETTDDDTVYLVHAGTTESYYHEQYESYNTEKILTGALSEKSLQEGAKSSETSRDWKMYVDEKYAISATSLTKEMLDEWGDTMKISTAYNKTLSDDLIKTGSCYWLGQGFNSGFVWRVSQTGLICYYMDEVMGIRPVIKLKAGIITSGQSEQIVGTDGKTTKLVWQLD